MYNGRIQLVAIAGSILLIVFILILIRKRRLKEEYSILWLFFSFVFLILSFWRGSIDWLAAKLGVAYSPAALLLVLLMAIFVIMIEFSTIISKISESNKNLAQDLGLLKEELDKLKNKNTKEETPNQVENNGQASDN
ncbi:MAG: DUF2304 domain-containing protein [Bacteroidales bacterium]|nr:DUF2304 domain-containing protein [Bacteroidales bacterium]MCF8344979.1 DUF2304 domain-containing protein [Bacteroidales bacterium]MCF8350758.1 DUF2304 domain-containing protein [Bacteroidales bacterium]MCF8377175.1 DUF2304 domain-containing protein [Bacteroidales bacterium]MCF8402224.1 DUF2304 domain-containing protein [Bacteroidales bacterium]